MPSWADPTWTNNAFLEELSPNAMVPHMAPVPQPGWFCERAGPCPENLRFEIKALLPERNLDRQRDKDRWRNDGHLRFYQARFFDASTPGRALTFVPGAEAEALLALRSLFDQRVAHGSPFHIGRSCDSVTLAKAKPASVDYTNWYRDRLGIKEPILATPKESRVDVALIDSGIDPLIAADIRSVGPVPAPPLHHHGSAMALFIHEAAPRARIHDLRVFDVDGHTTIETVARAIDCALFDIDNIHCMDDVPLAPGPIASPDAGSKRPLVINLSLGWPPELSQPATLTSRFNGQEVREDPVGESVRFLLEGARRIESKLRPVFVVAATGNRPERLHPQLSGMREARFRSLHCPSPLCAPPAQIEPECGASPDPYSGQPWFFPAEWAHRRACQSGGRAPPIVFGVGAVDDRELPIVLAIPNAESPLVAPGQYVYAQHAKAAKFPNAMICNGTFSYPTGVRFPYPFTGTSVSAAFVSGAAARAQERLVTSGTTALDWNALSRLLYLTGENLPDFATTVTAASQRRQTEDGVTVRRASIRRLDKALGLPKSLSTASKALLHCIWKLPGIEAIDKPLENACQPQLTALGLAPKLIPSTPGPIQLAPSAFAPCPGLKWTVTATAQDVAQCAGACPFEQVGYRTNFGSISPQPGDGVCVECATQSPLKLQLSPNHYPGTTVTQAFVLFSGPSRTAVHTTNTYYLDLVQPPVPNTPWLPGQWLHFTFPQVVAQKSQMDLNWAQASQVLVLRVKDDTGREAMEYAPIRVKLDGP